MPLDPAFLRPWRVPPNRVQRFYRGGALMERFRSGGDVTGDDGDLPEDWVGSATRAWTRPGAPSGEEGLGVAVVDDRRERIVDLLEADPAAVGGSELVRRAGVTTGLLVKLLDAAIRLPVHCHPSRAFARSRLGSFFGKAESWIVLAARDVPGSAGPSVRLGFRRELGRDELIELIEQERTVDLLGAMHERPTGPGDVWFVPPGLPHAIGAGIFIVEIQEPSDFSIVAETGGLPIDPADAHLGLGWQVTIDAFDREAHDDVFIDGLRRHVEAPAAGQGLERHALTEARARPFFRAERLTVRGRVARLYTENAFFVGVVTRGHGVVRAGSGELALGAGDTFALPAMILPDMDLEAADGLELIACLPPDSDALPSASGGP
jgi:mannose-6-phosphate isomerase